VNVQNGSRFISNIGCCIADPVMRFYVLSNGALAMALRKQFSSTVKVDPELDALLQVSRKVVVTEEMLREQRVSFAFGNAMNSDRITKNSVRVSSQNIRLIS